MKTSFFGLFILLCFGILAGCKPNRTFTKNELSLIPKPQQMEIGPSSFKFRKSTKLVVENVDQQLVAKQFANLFRKATGWDLRIEIGGNEGPNRIFFKTETVMLPEAYSLVVTEKRIEIKAAKPAGFFYALQTLRQLLPIEIESPNAPTNTEWLVPAVNITDVPSFKWRGFMLDVSRHFFTKAEVLKLIDNLAFHKINSLQLHLSDDQGWRIELKKYPKLTQIGAWRAEQGHKPWSGDLRPNPKSDENATYGGFYTQDDIREIVAYASERFINIVPEIEMPAHSFAPLASYPQFSCTNGEDQNNNIYCAGNDSSFIFLQDVLSEIIDLFPSKYIHIGGDEANKTVWSKCPKCKALVKTKKMKSVEELQSYFINRIDSFISSKNRILLGWDEILEGGLAPHATVMSWRGMQGGINAANKGHDVVMTPTSPCYFDYYQGPTDNEPQAFGGYNPLSKVYQFNPVPPELSPKAAKHILGGQANLWTEYVQTLKHAEYMAFPRVAALSEALWTSAANKNWNDFSRRIQLLMKRYDLMGINYSKSAYNVLAKSGFDENARQLQVALSCEFPNTEIHYTTDGNDPTNLSPVYTKPVVISQTTTLKAITFTNGIPVGKTFSQLFNINKATNKPVKYLTAFSDNYKGSGEYCLVNGIRGSANHSDGEWQGWQGNNLEIIVDLQQAETVQTISIGALQNNNAWIFFPQKVEFLVSKDGNKYRKVAESINDPNPMTSGIQLKDFTAAFEPTNARFIKIKAINIGKGPKDHVSAGKPVWLFADEIKVE